MVPDGGSSVTVWADPRVTQLGRRLWRLKLDELLTTLLPAGRAAVDWGRVAALLTPWLKQFGA